MREAFGAHGRALEAAGVPVPPHATNALTPREGDPRVRDVEVRGADGRGYDVIVDLSGEVVDVREDD
ncbi:hypothetical protein [Nocardiopsis lambiniae]|uniref:PepSY domain-containing protein n=1 Tax=Nocardiopsis lambiniae TaxID=3075539 RepID=A0ABU2MBU8_9ACTN|nr:hypothetical protein [Nocardiopsis sp. DSM 44743]MDT0329406.1 hypothetical protein [Nocardiopsis sp. DSM 44743]